MSAPDLTGEGTPEADWRAILAKLPEISLPVPVSGRVVVVAPHPDDEALGAGGAMRLLAGTGAAVTVIAVTDGEGSHPDSPTVGPEELIRRRRGERMVALSRLGLSDVDVHRLRLPDSGVERHERRLTEELTRELGPGDLCLAPWAHDGHPDHDATGRAATAAAASVGAASLAFLVWMWHWAAPSRDAPPSMVKLSLDPESVAAKRDAVQAFVSQIHPLSAHPADAAILPPLILERLTRDHEVFVR
jgi:LmbE family N-acetylglucosaminyl deacetylase